MLYPNIRDILSVRPCLCHVQSATSAPNLSFSAKKTKFSRNTNANKNITQKSYEPCNNTIHNNNNNNNELLKNTKSTTVFASLSQFPLIDNVSAQLPVLIDLPWEDISFEPIPKSKKNKRKRLRPSNPIVKPVEGVACLTKPCPEIGCSDCKTKCGMESHMMKELPDKCQNALRCDEVNIMYKTKLLKETESCKLCDKNLECENPCIIASSRIINQTSPGAVVRSCITLSDTSKETCHKFVSNEPLSEISDGKILKTKIMYKISKPRIIEESSREKTIRTRIHIIRQDKANSFNLSTHATASQTDSPVRENITNALASYESEIRPLREALTSLQQKLKNLDFQDLTSSMSTIPVEPTLSTHFIMNVSQKDNALQSSYISDFSEIVKETEYSNYSIKKHMHCVNTCEKQS